MDELAVKKDEDNELPVPTIWRHTFKTIVKAFVQKDYKLISAIKCKANI